MIVDTLCTYEALLSSPSKLSEGCVRFERNKTYKLDLSDPEQRKLTTLSWKFGTHTKWVFEFDRANSSDPASNLFFCKECGAPFDKLNELGTHSYQLHNKNKAAADMAKKEADAETELELRKQLEAEGVAV